MAYKFNGGYGAVICDNCRVIMTDGLSHEQYEKIREQLGLSEKQNDFCGNYLKKECEND